MAPSLTSAVVVIFTSPLSVLPSAGSVRQILAVYPPPSGVLVEQVSVSSGGWVAEPDEPPEFEPTTFDQGASIGETVALLVFPRLGRFQAVRKVFSRL